MQGFASREVILRRLTGPKVVRTDDGSRAGPEPQLGDNRVSTL